MDVGVQDINITVAPAPVVSLSVSGSSTAVSTPNVGGPKGDQGIQGEKGDPGTGVNIKGSLNDPSELPPSPAEGDSYLINGDLYVFDGIQWNNVGSIKGPEGRKVELLNNGTQIQWRYEGDAVWTNLIALSAISGTNGVDGADGTDGREVEIQNDGTNIKWRYVGALVWNNIVAVSSLKGADGTNGIDGIDGTNGKTVELQKTATHVQWRNVGDSSWINLIALADLKGANGTNGTSATVSVGTVTTGAPGSSVSVTNSGTSSAAVLDFTIPKGDTGASGSGAGDMLAANNLSELTNTATARTNLGLAIGTDVQAYNAALTGTTATFTSAKDSALSTAAQGAISSINNTIPRFSGITGKILKDSLVVISDTGDLGTNGFIESTTIMGSPMVAADEVVEYYTDAGVMVDGVVLKDGLVSGRDVANDGNKLDGIAIGAQVNTVTSVAGKTGAISLVKADVGLGNVDNTSDASKPISTATQTALNGKAAATHTHVATTDLTATGTKSSATYLRGDNTWATPTNTTYSEITSAEITAGTASTARTISGRRSQEIVNKAVASATDGLIKLIAW